MLDGVALWHASRPKLNDFSGQTFKELCYF
jgi:hypothetical protein